MGTTILLLLLVMGKLYECHVIYAKEPSRFRVAYEDWKPVRDSPLRHIRYPVYHKSNGYSYIPGKKIVHQIAEQSEKVEVFSPAPPTILGSFSVFGHATVNAREHASQINKKLPRHPLTDFATSETRPKVPNIQIRHQYPSAYPNYHQSDINRPQYAAQYNEPSYFYEASLRPPPHEQSKKYSHTSLAPTSYNGYEQGQIFHDEKYYKPQKLHQNSYRHHPSAYSTQLNDYKTTISPSNYDSTYSYYSNPNRQIEAEYYNPQNPVGSIPLNVKTDTKLKPVVENNVHDHHLSHYGRPFQNSQSYATVEELKGNFDPFVTEFPSSSTVEAKLKFSDVAQPFRVSSFENVHVSSAKPENTQQVYTEVFPISVTTIDVPTEVETQKFKNDYDQYEPNHHIPFKPSPYDHSNHKITAGSYQNYENNPSVFLPTPSTDVSPYLSKPKNEITTISHSLNNFQESNSISSVGNKAVEHSEAYTEIYPTVPIETTTKSKPVKSRRPSRPALPSTTTINYNQYWDNDYKYQRRRKPNDKVRQREGVDKNNFIKQRTTTTTTTTTNPPENEDLDLFHYTTILPIINSPINREISEYNGDKIEEASIKESIYEKNNPQNEDYDEIKSRIEESVTTSSSTTAPSTISTTQITTTAQASIEPGSRLKNNYGNRPRFSVKDYREKLNRATSVTNSPRENEKAKPLRNETEFKFRRTKPPTTSRTTTELPESTKTSFEPKFQKYKPRIGSSRYKITSTTAVPGAENTTTERPNTFKASTNRYKPGTGKYYSRYRTSTSAPKEVDNSSSITAKITMRPKGVFSAKRQPFPLKTKSTTPKSEENVRTEEEELVTFPDTLKINENEVYSAVITKKMDDSTSTTSSSGHENETFEKDKDTTGLESQRVADLTSSSSNDFYQSSSYKTDNVASKRPLSKITLPTDNPILPLEAFFQTQHK